MNESNDRKTINNTFVSSSGLALFLPLALLVLATGCATGLRHDPLEGWKDLRVSACPFDQTIEDDYRNYIQNLPPYERNSVRSSRINFYEGVDGRRAVKITTLGKGFIGEIWWERILIYDSKGKRIRTIKHKDGRSLS